MFWDIKLKLAFFNETSSRLEHGEPHILKDLKSITSKATGVQKWNTLLDNSFVTHIKTKVDFTAFTMFVTYCA